MKSYFAKLAARATLANAPESRAVTTQDSRDPFESNVVQSIAPPRPGLPQPGHATLPAISHVTEDYRLELQDKRRRSKTNEDDFIEPTQRLNPPAPNVVPPIATPEPHSDTRITLDPPQTDKQSDANTRELRRAPGPDTTRLAPPPPSPVIPTVSSKEKEVSRSTQMDDIERLATIQKEQSMLLRKADAFMAGLFDRSQRTATREDADGDYELRTSSEPKESLRQPATRLQPITTPARVAEPVAEEPSLVIGKLSVEVVPPSPAPVAPQRQVVVINAGQRNRAGIPSSQRFGFSRF